MSRPAVSRVVWLSLLVVGFAAAAAVRVRTSSRRPDGALLGAIARREPAPPTRARLSFAIAPASCREGAQEGIQLERSRCDASTLSTAGIDSLVRDLANAIRTRPDAGTLHAAGLAELIWPGDSSASFDRAIEYLRKASELDRRNASILGDLAAAHLIRAERTQSARDLLEAVEAADRALEVEPGNRAARYNAALALDRFGLVETARAAWAQYLKADSMSEWTRVANARYDRLRVDTVARPANLGLCPRAGEVATRTATLQVLGWELALGAWADAIMARDTTSADSAVTCARIAARTLTARGERGLGDAVATIGATRTPRALAAAHQAYRDGRALYDSLQFARADSAFARAEGAPHDATALLRWAHVYRGATLAYLGRRASAESTFRRTIAGAGTDERLLVGRAHWMLGTTLLRGGQRLDAQRSYAVAESLFTAAGDTESSGATRYLRGEAEYYLGQDDAAYAHLQRGIQILASSRRSVWLHNALSVTAAAAAGDRLPHAALRLADEGTTVAARAALPVYLAEAQLGHAALLSGLGRQADARAELSRTARIVDALREPFLRQWYGGSLRLAQLTLGTPQAHAPRSAATFDTLSALFSSVGNRIRLLSTLLARASLRLDAGELDAASADVDSSLAILRQQRPDLVGNPLHATLIDSTQRTIDRLVMARVARGQITAGLRYLDGARLALTATADSGATSRRSASPVVEIRIRYLLVGDTLLAWTVRGADVRLSRRVVRSRELLDKIARARTLLELGSDVESARPPLAALHRWLIAPIEDRLGSDSTPLALSVDGPLAAIPFAALWDARAHRYLVESHAVRLSLSARAGDSPQRSTLGAPLFIADPAFDAAAHPGLRRLPGAAEEVRESASSYRSSRTLAAADATRERFVKAMAGASLVHFAGHALVDDVRPERSQLVLAPSTAGDALTAVDLAAMNLSHVGLVILSACRTATAHPDRPSGIAGFGSALLAAGVGSVLGSLWEIDDHATATLMRAFHERYRLDADVGQALHSAQLQMLRSKDPSLSSPATWAGVVHLGH